MATQSFERIKTFARIRPSREATVHQVVKIEGNGLTVSLNDDKKTFQFDGLFGEDSTQEDVFNGTASRIVHGTLQGYNGTIFAYGQTGSGKTHTMIGPPGGFAEQSGIIPRGLHLLFEELDKKSVEMPGTFTSKITISFIEIYNENIYDLFVMNDEKLKIGQDSDGNVMVKGATEIFVKDLNDAMEEVKRGWNNRSVAETQMNRSSSRSHALLLIKIRTEEVHNGNSSDRISTARSAFLNLVDLAGSERVSQSKVEGDRFKETTNINKSLLTLKIVIRELSENKTRFVSFRNSMLTHILKDSLGGNARTAVMINVHPDKQYYSETLSTLQFSAEVRRIENKVVVNEDLKGDSVTAYKVEIRRLQDEIDRMANKNDEDLAEMKRSLEAWKEAANRLERQLAVARRNAVNAAIVSRKEGYGAVEAESIWERSMAEVAETARKLPTTNIKSMHLRDLTEQLGVCAYEKDELNAMLELERKEKMALQEKLKRFMEGPMSPFRVNKARQGSSSSQEELPPVSSTLGPLDVSFATPASRKERRRTRFTHPKDRQSNFFRPVLDLEEDNEGMTNPTFEVEENFEEKELKLEMEINTHKQIIDEKTQECEGLRRLLEGAEKRIGDTENALSSSDEKVKELTAELDRTRKAIGEEKEKLIRLERESSDLEGQLIEANGQIERLDSDIALLKSTHLDEMRALEENLKSNLSDKEKKEVDLKKEIDALKAEIESMAIVVKNKEVEKEAADDVLSRLTNQLLKNEKEKNARVAEMEELKEAMDNGKKELKEMKEQLDQMNIREEENHKKLVIVSSDLEMKKNELLEEREKMDQLNVREKEYKDRISSLISDLETKRKKLDHLGESSSAQLATLRDKLECLAIEKDNEIEEIKAENSRAVQNWTTVSLQFSQKMDELKNELSSEKDKRETAEANERRMQEVVRLRATENDELKENISALGSHTNSKQKIHVLGRYVESTNRLNTRVLQLESALRKHGLDVPLEESEETENGSPRDSVSSEVAPDTAHSTTSSRRTRATASSAAVGTRSTRSTRATTAGGKK